MKCKTIEQKNPLLVQLGYSFVSVEEGITENPIQIYSREVWERTVDGVVMQLERWLTDGVEKNSREYRADSVSAQIRRPNILPVHMSL